MTLQSLMLGVIDEDRAVISCDTNISARRCLIRLGNSQGATHGGIESLDH
jgi:hypothetical protein